MVSRAFDCGVPAYPSFYSYVLLYVAAVRTSGNNSLLRKKWIITEVGWLEFSIVSGKFRWRWDFVSMGY